MRERGQRSVTERRDRREKREAEKEERQKFKLIAQCIVKER